MTPRLDPIAMTQEDTAIWCHVFLKAGGWPEWSHGRFQRCDRRDADKMSFCESHKAKPAFRRAMTVAGMVAAEIELGFAGLFL